MKINNLPTENSNKSPAKNSIVNDKRNLIPEPYKKVAADMEAQFAQFMLQQMNKTVDHAEEPSQALKYYRSLLTQENSESLSQSGGGLGVQDLILNQIYPEHLRTKQNYQQFLNSQNRYKKQNIQMNESKNIESGNQTSGPSAKAAINTYKGDSA